MTVALHKELIINLAFKVQFDSLPMIKTEHIGFQATTTERIRTERLNMQAMSFFLTIREHHDFVHQG